LADLVGQILVQFVGDTSADVVGLESGKRSHDESLSQTPLIFRQR
jgi:hypothetical protein